MSHFQLSEIILYDSDVNYFVIFYLKYSFLYINFIKSFPCYMMLTDCFVLHASTLLPGIINF